MSKSQAHTPAMAPADSSDVEPAWKVWLQIILLVLTVYTFLVSIGLLGSAFKLFGKGLASQLIEMTSNPMVGLVAGILATTLAQSSSTTTSIVVGLVAAGAMTIEGAIPVVMARFTRV